MGSFFSIAYLLFSRGHFGICNFKLLSVYMHEIGGLKAHKITLKLVENECH